MHFSKGSPLDKLPASKGIPVENSFQYELLLKIYHLSKGIPIENLPFVKRIPIEKIDFSKRITFEKFIAFPKGIPIE